MVEPTSVRRGVNSNDSLDTLFSSLASGERRRILGLVSERGPEPVPHGELASALAVWRHGNSRDDVSDEKRQDAAVTLDHVHLPSLTAAGLLEHGGDGDTVALADHPAYRDPGILNVIEDEALEADAPASAGSLDALFAAIADARRRTVLDVLSHQFGPIHVETLARELGSVERGVPESDVPAEDVDRILGSLHHVDLPHLSEAGLIEYDADDRMVDYGGHPMLHAPWIHSALAPEFRPSLTGESDPDGIGEMQGRDRVVSFGQSLCDRADDELFCMFTDTDLLEAGCFARIRDASRRGANVYLGTRDPTVREYVRENAPGVVLWEPNTDWLNLPVQDNRVGRLLMADREAVMLGTLGERRDDGSYAERAMVGEGTDNTLVVMIRQMLSPHLEEIDDATEDIESRLPL